LPTFPEIPSCVSWQTPLLLSYSPDADLPNHFKLETT
jgi:hypothetical protein